MTTILTEARKGWGLDGVLQKIVHYSVCPLGLFLRVSLITLRDVGFVSFIPQEIALQTLREGCSGVLHAVDTETSCGLRASRQTSPIPATLRQSSWQGRGHLALSNPRKKSWEIPIHHLPDGPMSCTYGWTRYKHVGLLIPDCLSQGFQVTLGKSFCKQMPQVSSQTGQHAWSVSADLTLKIGPLSQSGGSV